MATLYADMGWTLHCFYIVSTPLVSSFQRRCHGANTMQNIPDVTEYWK
jgi:hypothetical protein